MKSKILFCLAVLPLAAFAAPLGSEPPYRGGYVDEDSRDYIVACTKSACYDLSRDAVPVKDRTLHNLGPYKFPENTEDVVFYKCAILCEDITPKVVTIGDKKMVLPRPTQMLGRRHRRSVSYEISPAEGSAEPEESQRSLQSFLDTKLKPLTHKVHSVLDPFLPESLREKPAKMDTTSTAPDASTTASGATTASTTTTTTTTAAP